MPNYFCFENYFYRKNSQRGCTIYYKCSKCDSGCAARLIVAGEQITKKGIHSCLGASEFFSVLSITEENPTNFIDNFLSKKSGELNLYPNQIYQELLLTLRKRFVMTPYTIPSKKFVYAAIKEARGAMNLTSLQAVMIPPVSTRENGRPFFRRYWVGEIHGDMYQMMIWASNEGLSLMRYNSQAFIDGTFKCTPHPFYQCVIIMVFDHGTQLYIPCVFALLSSKNEYLYCELFHQIIMLTEYNWMPSIITTDFELALIKAVKQEFSESKLLGCYFHLKQSLFRKLIKYNVSKESLDVVLERIELLTVVPVDQIEKATEFIKSLTPKTQELENFWNYFRKTWLKRYNPEIWNCYSTHGLDIVKRTNNGLERYNRRINEAFSNAHPNICSFVQVIKNEFAYFDQRCNEIRQNSSGILYREPQSQINTNLLDFNEYLKIL